MSERGITVGRVVQLTSGPPMTVRDAARVATVLHRRRIEDSGERVVGDVSDAMGAWLDGFVRGILHGSVAHRDWLLEAAVCYKQGRPVPPPPPEPDVG